MSGGGVRLHLVGIGGIGMSGIAEILLDLGHAVSGSDVEGSERTERLRRLGADVSIGHRGENVAGASYVVHSSAVPEGNPELAAAREAGVPVLQRTEMLAELMRLKKGVSVAGTHGKTTTTGILTTILQEHGLDPSYLIGGKPINLRGHARVGRGEHLVVEADESDGNFLLLNPIHVVVTNIDYDHMDFYASKENVHKAFGTFFNKIPFYGSIALNAQDGNTMRMLPGIRRRWTTFGILGECEKAPMVHAEGVSCSDDGSSFEVFGDGRSLGEVSIGIVGRHNVLNALGAITVARSMGVPFDAIRRGARRFQGIERRFERMVAGDRFEIFDDYGHHPTEVLATLSTFRMIRPGRRRVVIFEPHRFTRTQRHWDEFTGCFGDADELFLLDIYPASEPPIPGVHSENLARAMRERGVRARHLLRSRLHQTLTDLAGQDASVMTLGAGSIGEDVRQWVAGR